MAFDPRRRPRPQRTGPRRVVGGLRPAPLEPSDRHWVAQRWLRILDDAPDARALTEGLAYAESGQTRSVAVTAGAVRALVQGRRPRAYAVSLATTVLTPWAWDAIVDSILADTALSASLLAGELPTRIEDLAAPTGAHLVAADLAEITPTCDCGAGPGAWCKHAVCAMRLAADALHESPMSVFLLRGKDPEELRDALRRRRATLGAVGGATLVYPTRLDLPEDAVAPPLEDALDRFWEGDPAAIDAFDTTPDPPEPTHALLRRLGPPPAQPGGPERPFPLVGLLASCYDRISEEAAASTEADAPREADGPADPRVDDGG